MQFDTEINSQNSGIVTKRNQVSKRTLGMIHHRITQKKYFVECLRTVHPLSALAMQKIFYACPPSGNHSAVITGAVCRRRIRNRSVSVGSSRIEYQNRLWLNKPKESDIRLLANESGGHGKWSLHSCADRKLYYRLVSGRQVM